MKALFLSAVLALTFLGFVVFEANRPVGGASSVMFVVAKGDGPSKIAGRLKDAGLIRSANFFDLTVWSRGDRVAFQAGRFELSPSMTTREVEAALAHGKPATEEREVRVIEGWTLDDIAAYLEKEGVAPKKAFFAEAGESARLYHAGDLPDRSASFPALADKPASASLEGYLFPDTYRIYVDSDAKALVRRMLENFESKFSSDLRAETSRRGLSVFDVVRMASVIEAEVRTDDDRAMVSDIFWRRIAAGQGLEADSTVNYATGKSMASVGYADTKIVSPWNTYKYPGLPAGPIDNPGLSALRAAVFPKPNPYWYFLTDKDGNVHYAKTLDEQIANKRKYLH